MDDKFHTKDLLKNDFTNLDYFSFDGIITKCKVVNVYDGDTVTIVFYMNDTPIKTKFRLLGYDAPEIKPRKSIEYHDLHVKAGKKVRDCLKDKILGKLFWVKFTKEDKYGRALGNLYEINNKSQKNMSGGELSINDWIITNRMGKKYDGGTKKKFTENELDYIISI